MAEHVLDGLKRIDAIIGIALTAASTAIDADSEARSSGGLQI
jgi:hypothetical protein